MLDLAIELNYHLLKDNHGATAELTDILDIVDEDPADNGIVKV
ncbi:hypothetical protein ACFQS6_15985 [Xanthomonas populi]|nr:hypothetical protein [Xanthomonas populi]